MYRSIAISEATGYELGTTELFYPMFQDAYEIRYKDEIVAIVIGKNNAITCYTHLIDKALGF